MKLVIGVLDGPKGDVWTHMDIPLEDLNDPRLAGAVGHHFQDVYDKHTAPEPAAKMPLWKRLFG